MNMIMMLIIFTVFAFASIIMMCLFKGKMPPKIWNAAFIVADLVVFFCWNYAGFERGWLDEGWMTLENISPLCCTLVPLTLVLSDKVRQYVYDFIAFLSVGLFAAMLISPEFAYFFNYDIEANFLYASEAACHLVCCLFGVYLVLSGQVKPEFKSWVRSLVCCFSIVGFGVFLNFVFHKTHFGMNPYGESTIYMLDIFDTHWQTLLAYSMGVILVLTVGMQVMRFLDVTTDLLHKETTVKDGIAIAYHRIFDAEDETGDEAAASATASDVIDRAPSSEVNSGEPTLASDASDDAEYVSCAARSVDGSGSKNL